MSIIKLIKIILGIILRIILFVGYIVLTPVLLLVYIIKEINYYEILPTFGEVWAENLVKLSRKLNNKKL